MLCLSGFELHSRWVPLLLERTAELFNMIVKCNRDPPLQVFANNT